jgi:predicted phosphoribosyltransferase
VRSSGARWPRTAKHHCTRYARHEERYRDGVGVPIASREACDAFRDEVDDIVCALTPEPFVGVGYWYEDFEQTTDAEVHGLLARAAAPSERARAGESGTIDDGPPAQRVARQC